MSPVLSTIIAVAIVALFVGGAIAYIIHAKKSGKKCIGCPDSKTCSGNCQSCSCGCAYKGNQEEK